MLYETKVPSCTRVPRCFTAPIKNNNEDEISLNMPSRVMLQQGKRVTRRTNRRGTEQGEARLPSVGIN